MPDTPRPLVLAADRPPWERQADESAASYKRFIHYRDQDLPRSLRATAEAAGVSYDRVCHASAAARWVLRAEAWDDERQRVRDREVRVRDRMQRENLADLAGRLAERCTLQALAAVDQLAPKDAVRAAADLVRTHHAVTGGDQRERVSITNNVTATANAASSSSAAAWVPTEEEREAALQAATVELFRRAGIGADEAEAAAANVSPYDILELPE